jgi:hypothetical protein
MVRVNAMFRRAISRWHGPFRPHGAWLGLVAIACAPPALAQAAERPDVKVGDQWKFAVHYTVPGAVPPRTWLVTAVSATGILVSEDGEPVRLTSELNVLESPRERESNPRLLAFPMEVGHRWRYSTDWFFKPKSSNGHAVVEVVVEARENVTVPAGTYDAFRLTSTQDLSGTSPIGSVYAGQVVRTYWYAPAARAIVRMVTRHPYLGPSTMEAVEVALQP